MGLLGKAFKEMKEDREPESFGAQVPEHLSAEAPAMRRRPGAPTALPGQKVAKSSDPAFVPVKIYVREATRKAAWRKWEDAGGGDFSDLAEKLLAEYVGA